jgi:hypothetical protein
MNCSHYTTLDLIWQVFPEKFSVGRKKTPKNFAFLRISVDLRVTNRRLCGIIRPSHKRGDEIVNERYLYGTAVPILLDGGGVAGRLARRLYTRLGLRVHWFGSKGHLLLSVYARKHSALPFFEANDPVTLRLLKAFARDHGTAVGILTLIPCSPEAAAFLARVRKELEDEYVLLDMPREGDNPLRSLVQRS